MPVHLTEMTVATIAVGFGFAWIIASLLLTGRLRRLSAEKHLGIEVPPLMTANQIQNWGGLFFLYGVSPWRFGDALATSLIYLVRVSVPLTFLFGGLAMFAGR